MKESLRFRVNSDLCLYVSTILYITSVNAPHNCVCLATKRHDYIVRKTLKEIMSGLNQLCSFDQHHCAMIGRRYIINVDNVIIPEDLTEGKVGYNESSRESALKTCEIKILQDLKERIEKSLVKVDIRSFELKTPMNEVNDGVGFVDLGLPSGLKWCTRNIDVDNDKSLTDEPEEYGSYISWGELSEKDIYDAEGQMFHWYDPNNDFAFEEDADEYDWGKSAQLPDIFDVANQEVSPKCHIPTRSEWKELIDNCTFIWCNTYLGTRGILVTSTINQKSIFLPASGIMEGEYSEHAQGEGHKIAYWSSTSPQGGDPDEAFAFVIEEIPHREESITPKLVKTMSFQGMNIRPVYGGTIPSSQARTMFWYDDIHFRVIDENKCTCKVVEIHHDLDKVDIPGYVKYKGKTYKVVEVSHGSDHMITAKSLHLPKTIKTIPPCQYMDVSERIDVDEENPFFASIDGVLVDKEKTTILRYPAKHGDTYEVPSCIEKIADKAFINTFISNINLANVSYIGKYSFYGSQISDVLGRKVTRIEEHSFDGCVRLSSLRIPSIERMGVNSVSSSSLIYLHLPASLKELNQYTFNCPNLLRVELDARPLIMASNPFRMSPDLKSFKINGVETMVK